MEKVFLMQVWVEDNFTQFGVFASKLDAMESIFSVLGFHPIPGGEHDDEDDYEATFSDVAVIVYDNKTSTNVHVSERELNKLYKD